MPLQNKITILQCPCAPHPLLCKERLGPHTISPTNMLEGVHKRAAKYITNTHTREQGETEANCITLGWCTLQQQRTAQKATLLHKAIHKYTHIPTEDLTNPRKPQRFLLPHSHVNSHLYSFFPSPIRIWNGMPTEAYLSPSPLVFKTVCGKGRETHRNNII